MDEGMSLSFSLWFGNNCSNNPKTSTKAERNISPIGENGKIGSVPESQLCSLTQLEPEQQREVWQKDHRNRGKKN